MIILEVVVRVPARSFIQGFVSGDPVAPFFRRPELRFFIIYKVMNFEIRRGILRYILKTRFSCITT
jgi:hypothetical protein